MAGDLRPAYSTLACPGWSVEEAADAARRYGYAGIEWRLADGRLLGPDTPPETWDRIERACRDLDVVCLDTSCVVAGSDADVVPQAHVMLEAAARIGAGAIRVFGGPVPVDRPRQEVVAQAGRTLSRVGARAESLGVRVAVETHDAWARGADVMELVESSASSAVTVLWDVLHTWRAGETPQRTLEVVGTRLDLVHLKDGDQQMLCPLGEGQVPLAEIFDLLVSGGYEGWLSFEWEKLWHPSLAPPDDALPQAITFLNDLSHRI